MGLLKVTFGDRESAAADRAHACARKVRYGRHSTALLAAAKMAIKGKRLEPYACAYCGGWHLGHPLGRIVRWLLGIARKGEN